MSLAEKTNAITWKSTLFGVHKIYLWCFNLQWYFILKIKLIKFDCNSSSNRMKFDCNLIVTYPHTMQGTEWKLMANIEHRDATGCVVWVTCGTVGEQLLVHVIHDVPYTVSCPGQRRVTTWSASSAIIIHTITTNQYRWLKSSEGKKEIVIRRCW